MRVTPSQMRAAVQTALRRADPAPPRLKPSEVEMLREHLRGVEVLLNAVEADPEWLAELRARAGARGRA